MHICMFTNTYLPHVGGVARSVHNFAQDLQKAGHRVLIVAPTFPEAGIDDTEGDMILRVPAFQNFNGSDFSMRIPVPFYINEKLDDFKADIIHSHHPYLLGDAAFRAARRRRLPLFFTHHTLYEEYTHYVTGDNKNFKRFARNLSTMYANLCDQVVAPSKSIADLIQDRGVTTPVMEIPTGVDTAFFGSADGHAFKKTRQIPENVFVIGHVGRLAPEKNLVFLAKSVARSMKSLSDTWFCVAGEGPEKAQIQDIFAAHNLLDRLVLTGNLTGNDLADAYQAMDMFVFSSKSETQGMVLTEAMAAGTPVIALDAPGAREVVRHNRNGVLLNGDADEKAFSQALCDAVSHPEKTAAWQQCALQTAQDFSRKVCAQTLSDLYANAISQENSDMENKESETEPWETFLLAIQTEWDLISQKAQTIARTIT
ncbi:MAG TPA: glycosyltransferase [Desulfotignum sp.]|nr:glycosyltransferase [Desulfotignum sp.]